jgi:hypothetical protein
MIQLIIADNQNELTKNQVQINALLDKLDSLGKKKGTIDLKKISSVISKIDTSVLTEFFSLSGLDKLDFTGIDVKQMQDFKSLTPDKIKALLTTTGIDKIDINNVIEKLSEKGDAEKGRTYIVSIISKLIDDYDRDQDKDKIDTILDFVIEKSQDKLFEFIEEGALSLYDLIAGCKLIKDEKNEELADKLKKSKLFKDGSSLSVKELLAKFTSRLMTQLGRDKATGNITEDQMNGLEEFLKNQKL